MFYDTNMSYMISYMKDMRPRRHHMNHMISHKKHEIS